MDDLSKKFLHDIGIQFANLDDLNSLMIPRETFLSNAKYAEIKDKIRDLKNLYSSSSLTGFQNGASVKQKWPLLNIVRQILNVYNFHMEPIRKSDGYTQEGVKKYKRFFIIKQKINRM